MPKRRCHQARNEKRAEHAAIHGNPESGNHVGTVTLIESVEMLSNSYTYSDYKYVSC